jgi:Peroxiredoxin
MLTYSNFLPLGTKLPHFNLLNTTNNKKFDSIKELCSNKAKIIMFICNHCPYVIHYHNQIKEISDKYQKTQKVEFIAISSNDVENYPADAPDKMTKLAKKLKWNFPYLYDKTQEVAKKYQAQCTPEFYLFDDNELLIYRGRMDSSSPDNNKTATGGDLKNAIDNFLAGKRIDKNQFPSMGCNIKWK